MSESQTKYDLDVLVERYKLYPELKNICVEGVLDQIFIEEYLENKSISDVQVIKIDDLATIPKQKLFCSSLSGVKGRLLTVARSLEDSLNENVFGAICLVDKDLDEFLNVNLASRRLLLTDYSCFEMYFFNEGCIGRILKRYFRSLNLSAVDLINQLSSPLVDLFLIRLALKKLSINEVSVTKIKFKDSYFNVEKTSSKLQFDSDKFINHILTSKGQASKISEFREELNTLRGNLASDNKQQINGHDFVKLLSFFTRKCGISNKLSDFEVLERVIPLSLSLDTLDNETLFSNLRHYINNFP